MFRKEKEHWKALIPYQSAPQDRENNLKLSENILASITSQVHAQINIMSKALEEINTQISIMSKVLEDINNQISNMSETLEDHNIQIDIRPGMNMGRKLEKLKIKTEMKIKMKNIIGEDFVGREPRKS